MIRKVFLLFSLSVLLSPLSARSWYVSPAGNDAQPGSIELPLQTIHKACELAVAGDSVLIRDGVYPITREIRVKNSGSYNQWITLMAYPGEKAVIDADGWVLHEASGRSASRMTVGALQVEKVNYIRVQDLIIRNSHAAGIILRGPDAHNVHLTRCTVIGTYNSGIGVWYTDSVKVTHCDVSQTNDMDRRTPDVAKPHEAPHEAISICGAKQFEIAYNHVHLCYKEGIDCKEVSRHGSIHHNHVHNILRQGLYVDSWFGLLEDVEFHSNVVYECEWGMAISAEGKGSEMRNIRIYNNLLFNNRASGLIFGVWGHDLPRTNIFVFNNTIYNNGLPGHWASNTGGIDMRSKNLHNLHIYNNICYNNWGYEISMPFATEAEIQKHLKDNAISVTHNLVGRTTGRLEPKAFFEPVYAYVGQQAIVGNPLFVNAAKGDFRLSEGSPAINAATRQAPVVVSFDLGAISHNLWSNPFFK